MYLNIFKKINISKLMSTLLNILEKTLTTLKYSLTYFRKKYIKAYLDTLEQIEVYLHVLKYISIDLNIHK